MPLDLSNELFRLQGVTPLLERTWFPELNRERRLLVPIQVDALAVRSVGGDWADCGMRSPDTSDEESPSSLDLLPDPFTDLPEPRPRGVYLHWAMPDALLRLDATGDPDEEPSPPALPDRWVVVRVWSTPGRATRDRAAWILDPRAESGPIPLGEWTEATPEGLPITGLGTGDPAWSAYYDNTIDRFAFYDDLGGVSGSVSYLVCGWYARSEEDPIGGADIRTWDAFHARLAALEWEADHIQPEDDAEPDPGSVASETAVLHKGLKLGHATLDAQTGRVKYGTEAVLGKDLLPIEAAYRAREKGWPEHVLLHGAVVGVGWPRSLGGPLAGEVGGPPDPSSVRLAFSPSGPEALGAVVAADSGEPRHADAVASLALGSVPELDDESALARLDDSLHEATFAARKAEDHTTETIWQAPATGPYQLPDPPRRSRGGSRVQSPKEKAAPQGSDRARLGHEILHVRDDPRVRRGYSLADFLVDKGADRFRGDDDEGEWVTVRRPGPRWYEPADPVLLIQGARRSLKHGGDGRYSEDGRLPCRLSDQPVRSISVYPADGSGPRVLVLGDEILERGLNHGAVPPACDALLRELVVLDPGSAPAIADRVIRKADADRVVAEAELRAQSTDVVTEQTAWWSTTDPRVEKSGMVAMSGLEGVTPCPLALRPSNRPWVPVHLDWEVDYIPSDDRVNDWALDEIDLESTGSAPGDDERSVTLSGRCLLDPGLAEATALTLRNAHEAAARSGGTERLEPKTLIAFRSAYAEEMLGRFLDIDTGDDLADIAQTLEDMDVLAGALESFHERLRQRVPPDGSAPDEVPDGFVPLRAGTLRLRRVRLVDAFGQVLWLAGSDHDQIADPDRFLLTESVSLPEAPAHFAAPPRFTAPARLWFRWVRSDDATVSATPEHGPVCGWVLPDHLDGALEFFDTDGEAQGQLRLDPDVGALWELAPGRPSTVGGTPSAAMTQPQLAGIAQALVERGLDDVSAADGRETALAALLRVIDSTLWTVDPYGHVGEEHLSLLIGHPVAVLRAVVRLEVAEPVADVGNEQVAVPIRLGALTHWKDGLFGYFVDDDFHRFRCVRSAAAELALDAPADGFLRPVREARTYYQRFLDDVSGEAHPGSPVVHPYIDRDGLLWTVPGQTHVLTLLVEPHCVVHATTGMLPRKEIGLRREWTETGLANIAPTFRYGPVLRDPREVRMPIAADVGGAWTWTHREDVDAWAEEPVTHDGGEALLPPDPAVAQEGWLRLNPEEEEEEADG